MEKLRKACVLD